MRDQSSIPKILLSIEQIIRSSMEETTIAVNPLRLTLYLIGGWSIINLLIQKFTLCSLLVPLSARSQRYHYEFSEHFCSSRRALSLSKQSMWVAGCRQISISVPDQVLNCLDTLPRYQESVTIAEASHIGTASILEPD